MNHNRTRQIRLSLCAMAGTMLLTGFTSLAAETDGSNWTIYGKKDQTSERVLLAEETPEWAFSNIAAGIQTDAVNEIRETAAEAQKAYEKKQEEEREAAEARRIAEEKAAAEAAAQAWTADQKLLAALIFCEAGNQPYEGQVAVGAVVMNRVNSSVYPNTISEVIYQSGQFTPAMTGWLDSVLVGKGYTESAMQAAADALAGSNPVGDCLYFSTGGYGLQIGDHYFH